MKNPLSLATLIRFRGWLVAGLALSALACEAGGVGDPCIPEDEYNRNFNNFSIEEVNVESRSFQCETRVCLVNQFRGRVSCPYGQRDPAAPGGGDLQTGDLSRCRIPGTSGDDPNDFIAVAVESQYALRRAEEAVYCSCRCANVEGKTDDGARYCECPSGFTCRKLVDDVGLGGTQLAGSYCVKNGTETVEQGEACSAAAANCSNPFQEAREAN